jgi:hypothetical protein
MNYKITTIAIASVLALSLFSASADDDKMDPSKLPPVSSAPNVTYDKDIKPIFENSCVKCHHGDHAKGKLHLDNLEGAIKGGKEGPDIIVGKSDKSPLVYAVAHVGDEDDFMPPPKNKAGIKALTPEQVGLIRTWIDQGAK